MADNVRTIIVSWSEYECNVETGSGGCHIVVCYCHGSRPQATHKLQAGPCWNQDYIPTFADAADWHMVTGCQESSCKFPISYQWSRRSITEYRYEAVPLIRLSGESAGARGASRGRQQRRVCPCVLTTTSGQTGTLLEERTEAPLGRGQVTNAITGPRSPGHHQLIRTLPTKNKPRPLPSFDI